MADLGALSVKGFLQRGGATLSLPIWAATHAAHEGVVNFDFHPIHTAYLDPSGSSNDVTVLDVDRVLGVISGVYTVSNVPVANAVVVVLDGRTFMVLRKQLTAANGSFSFTGLNRLSGDYLVIARHPLGTEKAEIFDRIDAL